MRASAGVRVALAVLLCASPVALAAQEQVALTTGQLTITHDDMSLRSYVSDGRQQMVLESPWAASVAHVHGNSALIETYSGGTACPAQYQWITLDRAGLHATESFGTCSDLAEVQMTDQGPMVVLPRMGRSGTAGFVVRNGQIVEHELGLASAGVGDTSHAAAWSGRTAYDVLHAAEMEPALLSFLPWDVLEMARNSSVVSSDTMSRDGDWFAAVGCMPHNCNGAMAGVAISTRDGRILVGQWQRGRGGQVHGTPDSALPAKFRNLLSGQF
jgi:hypothetical protein